MSGNNGDIGQQTNNVSGASGRSQSYTYDGLDRLLTAQTQATSGGDCWGQEFGNNAAPPTLAADALANFFYTTATQCNPPQPQFTMNTGNNNQFASESSPGTGIGYDAGGNMVADTAFTYAYDAEGRIQSVTGMSGGPWCYTYDVFDLRVMKAQANGGSCSATPTVEMLYWRSTSGDTLAETDGTGSTTNSNYNEYVYFAGRRIAQSNPSSGYVYYYFIDHLGSTRVVDEICPGQVCQDGRANGSACYEVDYLPYGTENTPAGFTNTCSTHYRFTGYERDPETAAGNSAGNDYAWARYYNSRLGRFMSGDPLDGDISDPQTLNHYAYGRDNPLNVLDPTGMYDCYGWTGDCSGLADDPGGLDQNMEAMGFGLDFGGFFNDPNCLDGDCVALDFAFKRVVFGFGPDDPEPGCSMSELTCQQQFGQINLGSLPFAFGVSSPLPPGAATALNAIANGIANDPNCAGFLGSGAGKALNEMQQNANGSLLGTATIPAQGNEVNGATTFGGYDARTAINTIGAFYNSSYNGVPLTTDQGHIKGGTAKAQAFILLHELGHILGVLAHDQDSQSAIDANDQNIERNCKKTIKGF